MSEKRLPQTADGQIRYELKTPYRDGTTEVIYEPLDFISKLAALVPKRNVNLTRYHGVLVPNAGDRSRVVPSGRGRVGVEKSTSGKSKETKNRRKELGWAGRLKRVFNIEVTICAHCKDQVRVIGQVDDPEAIEKILSHVQTKAGLGEIGGLSARGPPLSRTG